MVTVRSMFNSKTTMMTMRRRMAMTRTHGHSIRIRMGINSTFMEMVMMEKGMMRKAMMSLQ